MSEQKKIEDMTIDELKILAYDQLCILEQVKTNLALIKQEMDKRSIKHV